MNNYNTLETVNIITFLKIMQDGNVNRLDNNFTESKQYTEEETNQYTNNWLKLYDDYFALKNDGSAKTYLKNQFKHVTLQVKILALSKQHDKLAELENNLKDTPNYLEAKQSIINDIKQTEPKLKINIFDDVLSICIKLQSMIKALNNEFKTIKVNQDKRVSKEKENVYNVIARVEQILERTLGDVSKISVSQFLAYEQIANNIVKSKEQNKSK